MLEFRYWLGYTTLAYRVKSSNAVVLLTELSTQEFAVRFIPSHRCMGKILYGAAIGALAWLLVLVLNQWGLLEPFELKIYDHLCRWQARKSPAPNEIVLIVVDQGSFDAAQKNGIPWPWPRQMYEPIVQFCTLSKALVVAMDITFNQPSSYGVEDDRMLATALEQNGQVFLPVLLSRKEEPSSEEETKFVSRIAVPLENRSLLSPTPYHSQKAPINVLAENAAGFGNVVIDPDSDGIYRRMPLIFRYGSRWIPVFGLSVVRHILSARSLVLEPRRMSAGEKRIPLDDQGNFLLTFYGGLSDFPRYSAFDIIQSYMALRDGNKPIYPLETFKDKVVFVGYSAPDLMDLKPTPVSSVYPGMAVHATLVANLLHHDFRVRVNHFGALSLAALVTLTTAITVLFVPSIWKLGILTLSYMTALGLFVGISFEQNLWVDPILLTANLGLAFALSTAFSYATEGRQRRQIKSMFSHYMSDLLIQDLIKNPGKLRLGGEKRELTVFFSDLAGFTSLSEKLAPEEVVALLNRYLTAMTDIILASGGIIDKYEGDAIMAFWGAPIPQDDHAGRACIAALDNQARLADLRQEFVAMGLPPVYARIGINTGAMIIGNMGSTQRFDFTVMGDSVNLASRLEGAGKAYGCGIIISEETHRQAENLVEVRELDTLRVKGKETPVTIYELLAKKGELDETAYQARNLFALGLAHYRKQKWTQAMAQFRKVLALTPEDGPSMTLIKRSEQFMEAPPPPTWDGVYRLTNK